MANVIFRLINSSDQRIQRILGAALMVSITVLSLGEKGLTSLEINLGWVMLVRSKANPVSNEIYQQRAETWFERAGNRSEALKPDASRGLALTYLSKGDWTAAWNAWNEGGWLVEDAYQEAWTFLNSQDWAMAYKWYMMVSEREAALEEAKGEHWELWEQFDNPGFELDAVQLLRLGDPLSDGTHSGWSIFDHSGSPITTERVELVLDQAQVFEGFNSILIELHDLQVDLVLVSNPVVVVPGEWIRLSGWTRQSGCPVIARLEVQFWTVDGQHLFFGPSNRGDSQDLWQQLQVFTVVPENAGWARARLRVFDPRCSKSRVWFDQVSLTRLEK